MTGDGVSEGDLFQPVGDTIWVVEAVFCFEVLLVGDTVKTEQVVLSPVCDPEEGNAFTIGSGDPLMFSYKLLHPIKILNISITERVNI